MVWPQRASLLLRAIDYERCPREKYINSTFKEGFLQSIHVVTKLWISAQRAFANLKITQNVSLLQILPRHHVTTFLSLSFRLFVLHMIHKGVFDT